MSFGFELLRAYKSELKASALSKLLCCKAIGLENSLFSPYFSVSIEKGKKASSQSFDRRKASAVTIEKGKQVL